MSRIWNFTFSSSHIQKNREVGEMNGSDGKESACSTGDLDSIPGSGRFPGEWNGSPLQYSCLKNPMDRGAWWATVHGVSESHTFGRLTLCNMKFYLTQCVKNYHLNVISITFVHETITLFWGLNCFVCLF